MTQVSTNHESQKKKQSPKRVKKPMILETNVVGIEIKPSPPKVNSNKVASSTQQVLNVIADKAIRISNELTSSNQSYASTQDQNNISSSNRKQIIQKEDSNQKSTTPLSKRKLVSSIKFIKSVNNINAAQNQQSTDYEESKLNADIQQQIQQNLDTSQSQKNQQEDVKYQIMINNLNEQTKKMIDSLGQKLSDEISSKLKSNILSQLNSNNLLNVQNPINQGLDDIKFSQGIQGQISMKAQDDQRSFQAQIKQQQNQINKKMKGMDDPNVKWFIQRLKNMIIYVKTQELFGGVKKEQIKPQLKQPKETPLKKYNMTSFIGQMAMSMNQPAFYKSKTKLLTEPLKYPDRRNMLPKRVQENECVKLYLSRLLNLAQEQVANKQNNQTDYSYKFDQQTLSINQYESQQTQKSVVMKLEKQKTKIVKKGKLIIDANVQKFIDKLIMYAKESKQQQLTRKITKSKRQQAHYDQYSSAEYSEKFESIKVEEQINDYNRGDSIKRQQKQMVSPQNIIKQQLANNFKGKLSQLQSQKTVILQKEQPKTLEQNIASVQWFINKLKVLVIQNKQDIKKKNAINDYYGDVVDVKQEDLLNKGIQQKIKEASVKIQSQKIASQIQQLKIQASRKKECVQKYTEKLIAITVKSKISMEELNRVHKAKKAMDDFAKTQKANMMVHRHVKKFLNNKEKAQIIPNDCPQQKEQQDEVNQQIINSPSQTQNEDIKYQIKQIKLKAAQTRLAVQLFTNKLISIAEKSKISKEELNRIHKAKASMNELAQQQKANMLIHKHVKKFLNKKKSEALSPTNITGQIQDNELGISGAPQINQQDQESKDSIKNQIQLIKQQAKRTKESVQKYTDKLIAIAMKSKISKDELDKIHKAKHLMEDLAKVQRAHILIHKHVKKFLKSKQQTPEFNKETSPSSPIHEQLQIRSQQIQQKINYSDQPIEVTIENTQSNDQRPQFSLNIKQPMSVVVKQSIRNKVHESMQMSRNPSIMFDNITITLEILNGKNNAIQEAEKSLDRLMRNRKLKAIKNKNVQKFILKVFKLAHRSKIQVADREQYILRRKFVRGFAQRIQQIQAERIINNMITSQSPNIQQSMKNINVQKFLTRFFNIVIKSKIKIEKLDVFRVRFAIFEIKRKFAKGFIKRLLRIKAEEKLKILIKANPDSENLKNKNVQRLFLKMLMISIRSRIPIKELNTIKEMNQKVRILKKFARGFVLRLQDKISEQIMERLISNNKLKTMKNENVQRYVQSIMKIAVKSRITVADLLKIKIQKGLLKIKKHFASGFALRLQQKVSEKIVSELVQNRELKALQNKQVQKLVLQVIQIAIKSRIPLKRLQEIKIRQGVRLIRQKFAKGFALRIQQLVPQHILNKMLINTNLKSLQNKNVQNLVIKVLEIAIRSRITMDQLQKMRDLDQAKKRIAKGLANRFQNKQIAPQVESQNNLSVISNQQAQSFISIIGRTSTQSKSLRKLQNLIHKHVDIVKTQEREEELQAISITEMIRNKRVGSLKNKQAFDIIKNVIKIAIRSKIPEEELIKHRNKKVPIQVIKNQCVQVYIERLIKYATEAYKPKQNKGVEQINSQKDAMKMLAMALQKQKQNRPTKSNIQMIQLNTDPKKLQEALQYSQMQVKDFKVINKQKIQRYSTNQIIGLDRILGMIFEIAYISKISAEELRLSKKQNKSQENMQPIIVIPKEEENEIMRLLVQKYQKKK